MLSAQSISKRFGATLALAGVSFTALPGEIHALLGENGAGKTTLMNVLGGAIRADAGVVTLYGRTLRSGSPAAALAAGISTVHQSSMLFERMSWEENLALGGFGAAQALIDLNAVAARAAELAGRLGFALPPPRALIESRSVTERVRLEVMRALSFNPRVLILDEPTAVLAPSELGSFLGSLRKLREEGRIVILITHKLREALAIADRITVLRRGEVVAETTPAATSEAKLARLIVGEMPAHDARPSAAPAPDGVALELDALSVVRDGRRVLDGIHLAVRRGAITGLAGVDGNGQADLVETLAGVRAAHSGAIRIGGAPMRTPYDERLAVIPQNRDLDGLILDMALWENLMLSAAIRKSLSARGWLDHAAASRLCAGLLERFKIRASGPNAHAAELSGGNRQRLEVARALAARPEVIVAHNVCRGLDIAATADVHRELREFAGSGGAVLLISSDLDELLTACDELAVISGGRLRPTRTDERTEERLGLLMTGEWT